MNDAEQGLGDVARTAGADGCNVREAGSSDAPPQGRRVVRSATVLRALAAGAGVFRDALEQAGLEDFYAKVAGIDSSRALAVGVLRCLERAEWHRAWQRLADSFRSAVLSRPA